MEKYKKEVKTNAIISAKEKALYLLSAIGSQIGKPIRIIENNENINSIPSHSAGLYIRGSRSDERDYYLDGVKFKESKLADEITFNKLNIEYKITARFEIK